MRLSLFAALAFYLSSVAAHADTLYGLYGTLASGTTFTGTIAFSPTGGVLNGNTFTAINLSFSDGAKLASPVFSTPSSGEHFVTESGSFGAFSSTFMLITTQVVPGFTSDPVCTLTQYCADESPFSQSSFIASTIDEQQVEAAYIQSAATSVTPEPSSIALLGTGILGLAGAVRKRLA